MRLLVTGGAGYIGSHVALRLNELGHAVTVLDNLSYGHEWAVLGGNLIVADLRDRLRLREILAEGQFDAVMHFAAFIEVEESMSLPLKYYRNNFVNALGLIEDCVEAGVHRFIFSSTAAVYGLSETGRISEDEPIRPVNPYGESKAMVEKVLRDVSATSDLRYVALRYFNAAGADQQARIGQARAKATHLITVALRAACGVLPRVSLFGTDYPTPDGTCVRDYIHVADLANAHVAALDYLNRGGTSGAFNCGYGHGHSVREVLDAVKQVTGQSFEVVETHRRPGDPPTLIANADRLREHLGWEPEHDDLGAIIESAWRWEQKYQSGEFG